MAKSIDLTHFKTILYPTGFDILGPCPDYNVCFLHYDLYYDYSLLAIACLISWKAVRCWSTLSPKWVFLTRAIFGIVFLF